MITQFKIKTNDDIMQEWYHEETYENIHSVNPHWQEALNYNNPIKT